jgi:CPA2 family monovalent cation:H+ antiporter-2
MHPPDFLRDLLIAFLVGGVVVYVLRPLKLPSLAGLLVAGAVIGPHGLSLIEAPERVEVLAEIGVVLLLFTIGLELSIGQLAAMWRAILGTGGTQVLLTIGVTTLCARAVGVELERAVFLGFLVSLSSTAVVLRLLGDHAELDAPHGRVALGILLLQDLCIVPLMLLTPVLAGTVSGFGGLVMSLGKAGLIVAGVLFAARRFVPAVLFRVVRTRSRELFLTFLVVLCLGTAWLTSLAGLSLALGAFLAGLAISESEYAHQALAEAIPFRDAFGSLFFLSIGMLMDVGFAASHPGLVAASVVGVLVVKSVTASVAGLVSRYPVRVAVRSGFALAQIGEFAFVLAQPGLDLGLIATQDYQLFLAASVLSLLLTPAMMRLGAVLGPKLGSRSAPAGLSEFPSAQALADHVIIVGYGVNGKNLARTLRATDVPYVVLELNPETVRRARAEGEPIHFGDSTQPAVLRSAGIAHARLLVVAISDAASSRRTVSIARQERRDLIIVIRTRYLSELEELKALGADEVIPEEFETSIEIFSRVLARYNVPRNVILDHVAAVREGTYEILRAPQVRSPHSAPRLTEVEGLVVERLQVRERSPASGSRLDELDLRARTGASVVAVCRGEETFGNPKPEFRFSPNDVAILIGSREELDCALELFEPVTE